MSRIILLGVVLAVLIAAGAMLTLKLPKQAAAEDAIHPAILHMHLQRAREEMALP